MDAVLADDQAHLDTHRFGVDAGVIDEVQGGIGSLGQLADSSPRGAFGPVQERALQAGQLGQLIRADEFQVAVLSDAAGRLLGAQVGKQLAWHPHVGRDDVQHDSVWSAAT